MRRNLGFKLKFFKIKSLKPISGADRNKSQIEGLNRKILFIFFSSKASWVATFPRHLVPRFFIKLDETYTQTIL
jgi:hypothetical protein